VDVWKGVRRRIVRLWMFLNYEEIELYEERAM
jgi:hypothetical protein